MRKLLLIVPLFYHLSSVAQITVEISGPTTANVGETKYYYLTWRDGFNQIESPFGGITSWYTFGGTVLYGDESGANVQWTSAGNHSLYFNYETWNDYYFDDHYINVTSSAPTTPSTTFSTTYSCGSTQVMRNTNPTSGAESWYWQTSATGTSTALGLSSTITRTSTGPLWLRARQNASPNTWSTGSQSVGTVTVYTTGPATPTVANHANRDGAGAITVSVGTVSGATGYKWYTVPTGGTAIAGQTTNTYAIANLTTTTTYYVSAINPGCESSGRLVVTATIDPVAPDENYIMANTLLVPHQVEGTVESLQIDQGKRSQSWQYFDGLGRPMQSVVTMGSPNKKDIVQPIAYDGFGREAVKYLPYVSADNNGWFKNNFVSKDVAGYTTSDQYTFYNNSSTTIAQDAKPYAETIFEPSPLNRPEKQFGAGAAWHDNNKHMGMEYLINNSATENVIAWDINGSGAPVRHATVANHVLANGHYATGQLFVNVTKDEPGNAVREYTNKQGQVVLKKVQAIASPALNNYSHWAATYYVYDDFGNLRYVFPPELTKVIHSGTSNPSQANIDSWAFQYKYDGRKRMVEKKVPGSGWVYMVYDKRDRLVLTQDANQRTDIAGTVNKKDWVFTKYDALNRPVSTGIYTHGTVITQSAMQTEVDNYYANLTGKAWFETYIGNSAGNVHGYDNKSFPQQTDVNKYLTITYYDNYLFRDNLWGSGYAYQPNQVASQAINGVAYSQPATPFDRVVGQVTGTKTKILDQVGTIQGGTNWLKTITYYDDRYRVVQSGADTHLGGKDWTTNLYDFSGKVLASRTQHENTYSVTRRLTYDHASRPQKIYHTVGKPVTWKNLVGVSQAGNVLTKITSATNWDAGALSNEYIPANTDGFIEFTGFQLAKARMIGLGDPNTGASYSSIDYAIYLTNGSLVYIYENGTYKGNFTSHNTTDIFRIERKAGTVTYYKNGNPFYTSLTTSTIALYADCSMNPVGSQVGPVLMHSVDNELLLVDNTYNELGELIDKKLHSTDGGTTFEQSVDYRYNIRGWLTKMNESNVSALVSGDQVKDYYGFELAYNNDLTTGNAANLQYNGNISAMKWSKSLSLGTIKENAYNYTYDQLNRLKTAGFREKRTTWDGLGNQAYAETGIGYDLNGNIKNLQRNDGRASGWMDNLVYTYTNGNQLLKVDDSGDDTKGFKETTTGNDYRYDVNGNLLNDMNKGIGSTVSDNTNRIYYNYLNLPEKVQKSATNYIQYIYDATGRKLHQYSLTNGVPKTSDYAGEFFYENDTLRFINHEEGRIVMDATGANPPEYQYNLKDHLGNVRLTFTSKEEITDEKATLEEADVDDDRAEFLRYDNAKRVKATIFDNTNGSSIGYSQRLSGRTNERYGLAKSIAVMPGDVIEMEVFAKYVDQNPSNWVNDIGTLLAQIANNTAGIVVDGSAYTTSTSSFPFSTITPGTQSTDGPLAFLNYIMFDSNYDPIYDVTQTNVKRITSEAKENGSDVPHERIFATVTVKQAGFMYIYLSNDEPSPVEVYFDDFTVKQTHSKVIQMDDYYPFGLTFNSYSREKATPNQYLYNGKELQDELDLGWMDYGARMYMPEIGRWGVVDALSEVSRRWSPYSYALNNPVRFIDPDGNIAVDPGDKFKSQDAAAIDFAMLYNDNSIKDNKEYATRIYKVKDKESGETYYTYNVPNVGDEGSSNAYPNVMQEGEYVARAHTHGADPPVHAVDEFSPEDKSNADFLNVDSYVATPNGSLQKYDYKTQEESTISKLIPSDKNHHSTAGPYGNGRLNNIDSDSLPKNEPTRNLTDVILAPIISTIMKSSKTANPILSPGLR